MDQKLNELEKALFNQRQFDLHYVDEVAEVQCVLCNRVAIVHIVASCDHLFCILCKTILSGEQNDWRCPKCRQMVTIRTTDHPEIDKQLAQLKAHCVNYKYGCKEIMELSQMRVHLKKCTNTKEVFLRVSVKESTTIQQIRCSQLNTLEYLTKLQEEHELFQIKSKAQLHELFHLMDTKIIEQDKKNYANLQGIRQTMEVFVNSKKDQLKKRDKRCLNILLLGETMHGKSTLINAFHGSIRHQSFQEALQSDDEALISTKFISTDDDYNEMFLTCGVDDFNECMDAGQSTTRECRSYLFTIKEDLQVRWIDTSGFAATWGPEHDEASSKDMVQYISQFEVIHAVAIVVNSKTYRLTTQFKYCLQQMLSIMHKSAIQNLIFIFTHGIKPVDALKTVKAFIKKYENSSSALIDLKIGKTNAFSFDNDGFVKLLEFKNNVALTDDDLERAESNWNLASNEYKRLINHIEGLKPHDVRSTANLHEVKTMFDDVDTLLNQTKSLIVDLNDTITDDLTGKKRGKITVKISKLEKEEKIMSEALKMCLNYLKNNSILTPNNKNHKYVAEFHRKISGLSSLTNESNISKFPALEHSPTVNYLQIQQLKKNLYSMEINGPKFIAICQLEENFQKKSTAYKDFII